MSHLRHLLVLVLCISAATATASALMPTAAASPAGDSDAPVDAPTPDQQVAGLEEMCAASAEARMQRHEETPLYYRLGEEEKINALTAEIMRLHLENDALAYVMDGVDPERTAQRVAMFIVSGTGGPQTYDGPSLPDTHRHMGLTNALFLAAGGDVIQAMKNLGYGQDEIDEMVCILVSLRDQVVLDEDGQAK